MPSFLEAISANSWDASKARHLLNRAGFGVPFSRVNELTQMGMEKALHSFLQHPSSLGPADEPNWLKSPIHHREINQAGMLLGVKGRQEVRQDVRRTENERIRHLKTWWLNRMRFGPHPLQEKIALFWHGHFATSGQKVENGIYNYQLNKIFRDFGMGNFKELVTQVGQSAAMLIYLDNVQNVKRKPNENWARELMELFTLGIGNYTEADIKESARAFTGWAHEEGAFVFRHNQHDTGSKTFLGQTGNFDGAQIIDILFQQKALAEFIPKKLWEFFVYENPEPALVAELSQAFKANHFEIAPLLKIIFSSQTFYSAKALHSQIKSPTQLLVQMFEELKLERFPEMDPEPTEEEEGMMAETKPKKERNQRVQGVAGRLLALAMRQMGQDLFFPPNVKGWEGNRAWINTNTLLVRYNLSNFLINGNIPQQPVRPGLEDMEEELSRQEKIAKRFARLQQRAPFQAVEFFRPYEGFTLGEVSDFLCDIFLGRALTPEQRTGILHALNPKGTENDIFSLQSTPESHLRGSVHLLLSLAEYQLC